MKEPIQINSGEVSIVIYDAPLPPRYLRFSKKFIRTLFVVAPVMLGLIFFILISIGFGTRLKEAPAPSLPVVISDEDTKINELENEIKSLQKSNEQLQNKLSGTAANQNGAATDDEPFLMNIKKPYGMQNLISENRVGLDQFNLVTESNKTSLKFQIKSNNPETKVSGHVLVFMITENGMTGYPAATNVNMGEGIKYSLGEPFAVSRLRPTNAEFNHKAVGDSVKFLIYLFSREGDLLLIKESGPYKLGNKS